MFTVPLFIIANIGKKPMCPRIKRIWYIYNGILLSHKKSEILPLATTWMELEALMLSEISQREKEKYCMLSFICEI